MRISFKKLPAHNPPSCEKSVRYSLHRPFRHPGFGWSKRVIGVSALLWLLSITCTDQQPVEPQRHTPSYAEYSIAIPVLDQDSIAIACTFSNGTRFILPCHFFDNPVDSLSGTTVRDLHITDGSGEPVDFQSDSGMIGPVMNRKIVLPAATEYPVTIRYRLDLSVIHRDSSARIMPRVYIGNGSMYLPGSYFLILPELSTSLAGLWRSPYESRVFIEPGAGLTIYGIPGQTFTCSTLYELLFIQLSAGRDVAGSGYGGGVHFVFLDFLGKTYPSSTIDSVITLFSGILDQIASVYGPFSGDPYTIGFHNIRGGVEGTFGFDVGEPASGPDSRFAEILAHEALHYFIGIRCGDYVDPWWKESAATYLGLETMVRLKFYSNGFFKARMTAPFIYADTLRFQHALSDPWLRVNMFHQSLHALVYERGAQVMMLLDVKVRRGSENRYTLHDVIADLCRNFSGRAFSREDFIDALERYGAGDVPAFFTAYVDNRFPVLDSAVLNRAYSQLDSLAGY